jgi:hypothetical protein
LAAYEPFLAVIIEKPGTSVSDGEIRAPVAEQVWLNDTVTSGRIIIGWRVGT